MIKHNQDGASGVALSLALTVVLLIGALGFGIWSFSSRQDYKNHTDVKVAAAVTVAKQQESDAKDKIFAEELKNPLQTYTGPPAYGGITLNYPKTWSSYIIDTSSSGGSTPIDAYFHPVTVPSVQDSNSVFSLRLQILNQSYSQTVSGLTSGTNSAGVTTTIKPYALPKVPKAVGVEVTGGIPNTQKTGTMVILPVRSQTIELWTETGQYLNDFNKYILPNFSFSP